MAEAVPQSDLPRLFEDTPCPHCNCEDKSKVQTTLFGGGAFIRTCSECNWGTGVDDTADRCSLGDDDWVFEPLTGSPTSCLGGNAKHVPVFIGSSKEGLMRARCRNCTENGIMFYDGKTSDPNCTDGSNLHDIEGVFTAILKNIDRQNIPTEVGDVSLSEILSRANFSGGNGLPEMNFLDIEQGNDFVCVCDCGINSPDLFEKICDDSNNVVEMRCSVCFARYSAGLETPSTSRLVCERCNNHSEEYFEKTFESGRLVKVKCFQCDAVFRFSTNEKTFPKAKYLHKIRVTSWEMIERGNHISWQRQLPYEHHAIVLTVHPSERKLRFIEYGVAYDERTGHYTWDGMELAKEAVHKFISNNVLKQVRVQVREETDIDLNQIEIYRYDYDPEQCFPPEEVIARAEGRLGETGYNVFLRNCEHFATWCKTGRTFCDQMKSLAQRGVVSAFNFISHLSKPVYDIIKQKVFKAVASGQSVDDVVQAVRPDLLETSLSRTGLTLVINFIIELVAFCYQFRNLKRDLDCGKITKAGFRQSVYELVGESIGGLLLGLLLGFSWLIGFGFVATMVLNFIGIIAGRILGQSVGSWIFKTFSQK